MPISDKYANMANASVEVTAGALAFTELLTGISLGQGTGIIIDQIDYYINPNMLADFDTDVDTLRIAWTASNSITSIDTDQKSVIHTIAAMRIDFGTSVTDESRTALVFMPITKQFFPPIIVAAPRLYLAATGDAGLTGSVKSRVYFRYVKLSSQEYLEIAESFVLVG